MITNESCNYTNPFKGKIPEKTIVSDVGICKKCFSQTIKNQCQNKECLKIVYRNSK